MGYSNANWAGDKEDRKSMSGYLFPFTGGPMSRRRKKQDTVALSTAEAEYVALSSAAQESVWTRRLNSELDNPPGEPLLLWRIISQQLQWQRTHSSTEELNILAYDIDLSGSKSAMEQ